jgi:uncharacterized protein (DUF924 family)
MKVIPVPVRWSAEPTDARGCLIRLRAVTFPRGLFRGTDRAIELLMKAAETAAFADRQAATDQVALVLRCRGLY